MGLKDNFSQALKELTGGDKEDARKAQEKKPTQIDELKRAMDTEEAAPIYNEPETVSEPQEEQPEQDEQPLKPSFEFTREDREKGATVPNASDDNDENTYAEQAQTYTAPTGNYGTPGSYGYNTGSSYQQPMSAPSQSTFNDNVSDDELTVISKNTVIDGNVRSFANMSVNGNIRGDVETTKDLEINGKIVGNITCNNAALHTSQVQGNIKMKGNVKMERDTLLIGDLASTYADVNGKIKGNIDVAGKAQLKSDAVIFGDISASTITVDDGAIIQGYVSTTFLNKEDSNSIFPDTIVIGD